MHVFARQRPQVLRWRGCCCCLRGPVPAQHRRPGLQLKGVTQSHRAAANVLRRARASRRQQRPSRGGGRRRGVRAGDGGGRLNGAAATAGAARRHPPTPACCLRRLQASGRPRHNTPAAEWAANGCGSGRRLHQRRRQRPNGCASPRARTAGQPAGALRRAGGALGGGLGEGASMPPRQAHQWGCLGDRRARARSGGEQLLDLLVQRRRGGGRRVAANHVALAVDQELGD